MYSQQSCVSEVGSRPLSLSKGAVGRMEAETLIRPVVEAAGLELVDVAFRRESGTRVLRVVVDTDGGVDVDTLADIAEKVSRRLDVEGFAPGPYALEVSSPGIERPLKRPRDFERRVGDTVRVKTTVPVGGRTSIVGALVSADDDGIAIAVEGGELHVRHAEIAAARTVADWDAELKGSTR
jgi:ribosome maturation factor RimP